jgi:hypothetical protein
MIIGACKAAIQERIKFMRIKGYGSKLFLIGVSVLNNIQQINTQKNEMINAQLPPKCATLSDIF